jgi:phosphoribosylformimino-5-aminoimidazole carboxamide ribonucleotide (ProFAR) isomerase
MGLIQAFIEAEAKKSIHQYRERFAEWLSAVDIDGNGVNDRQQILADFDRISDGITEVIGGLADLQQLSYLYQQKYGNEIKIDERGKAHIVRKTDVDKS